MTPGDIWTLAPRQHGIVERSQLRAAGFTDSAIKHHLARGRLRYGPAHLRAVEVAARAFVQAARRAGLGQPLGNCRVNGYDVDFYWPAGSFAAVEPLGQPWPP